MRRPGDLAARDAGSDVGSLAAALAAAGAARGFPWGAVEVVARALLAHDTLTEREVRRLMRSTLRESDDFPRPNLL
jgi:hypothetical protein